MSKVSSTVKCYQYHVTYYQVYVMKYQEHVKKYQLCQKVSTCCKVFIKYCKKSIKYCRKVSSIGKMYQLHVVKHQLQTTKYQVSMSVGGVQYSPCTADRVALCGEPKSCCVPCVAGRGSFENSVADRTAGSTHGAEVSPAS